MAYTAKRKPQLVAGVAALTVLFSGTITTAAGAQEVTITGRTPFAGCNADRPGQQSGTLYRNTEIEPWVTVNPENPRNIVAGWQQDRWSNGGSRGNAAGISFDGGASWRTVTLPGTTKCAGGIYQRGSDPWLDFAPDGTLYFMSLAFDEDLPSGGFGPNAMLVNRSTDGGRTFGRPITLIRDTDPQILNDKNTLTADPTDARYAYAVWDRLQDFTLSGRTGGDEAGAKATVARPGMDGVAITRDRVKRLQAEAKRGAAPKALEVFFKGPTYVARTTDSGRTWKRARNVFDPGSNAQTIGNQIVVTPNGTLLDFFDYILPNGTTRLAYIKSTDKGATWGRPVIVENLLAIGSITPDDQLPVRDGAILFDVAVDQKNGNLYAVWQDYRFRSVEEVAFTQSEDGGKTWSRVVRINRTPSSANVLRQQAIIPSVAVLADSTVVVTYYDYRFDRTSGGESADHWALFCPPGKSCERRESWTGETRLTSTSFDMLDAPDAGGLFLGDYVGLAAAGKTAVPVYGVTTGTDLTVLKTRPVARSTVIGAARP